MERLGILDPSNEVHLWCLHLVLLPIINKHIVCWQNGWIHHPIRTERNKTPMQLWIQGLNAISATGSTIANEVFQGGEDYDNYGIDWDQAAGEVEPDLVEVPETTTVLSEAQVEEIRGLIPENVTINNAIDIFTNILNRTLEYVNL
ncbi:Hypothetical predicted protein [Paramuricea clavata]|nr:Hypothetical predicted protein [Paramuricea clavata]